MFPRLPRPARRARPPIRAAAAVPLAVVTALPLLAAAPPASADPGRQADGAYRGQVEVVPAGDGSAAGETVSGRVFVDADRDSSSDGEKGLADVAVTNGRDVVRTDGEGRYELPAFDNMTVSMTQPAGYQVPLDENNIAQFHYNHLPEGSPELEHGGIEPTGPLPAEVNFPVAESDLTAVEEQSCIIAGDLQTTSAEEIEYARAGAIGDLAQRDDYAGCGTLFVGDVANDDLSLYPEIKELVGETNGPVRFLPGNHDLDLDSTDPEHSTDTFRAQLAPEYYSYDVGNMHYVALNTVEYPCAPHEDSPDGIAEHCSDAEGSPAYNGRLDEDQLKWLEQDLAAVGEDKLVVLAGHIGLVNYADQSEPVHQVDQVKEIHAMLEGREAIAVSGHSHSIENMAAGDDAQGWRDLLGVEGLPFPHITAGAISGDWYSGQVGDGGYPTAVGRDGGRPGVVTLDVSGSEFRERYTVTGEPDEVQTQLGINSPAYRDWYAEWSGKPGEAPEFADPLVVSEDDLAGGTWLTTNAFFGSTGAQVEVAVDGASATTERTQQMQGEAANVGAEWSDPAAVQEQLVHGGSLADRAMHLWRTELPSGLEPGAHTADVTVTDAHGREFTDSLDFEVVAER